MDPSYVLPDNVAIITLQVRISHPEVEQKISLVMNSRATPYINDRIFSIMNIVDLSSKKKKRNIVDPVS